MYVNIDIFQDFFEIKTPTKPDITLVQKLDYETVTEMEIYIEATVRQGR